MARLNLTLDDETFARLVRHAQRERTSGTALARRVLREGLDVREASERRRQLAADYAAGRPDARELLRSLETAQLEGFAATD